MSTFFTMKEHLDLQTQGDCGKLLGWCTVIDIMRKSIQVNQKVILMDSCISINNMHILYQEMQMQI